MLARLGAADGVVDPGMAHLEGIMAVGLNDEAKAKVLSTVRKQAAALEGLQEQVA